MVNLCEDVLNCQEVGDCVTQIENNQAVMFPNQSDVFSLFKTKSITANNTVELLTQPVIIQESEILKVQAANSDRLHVVVSFLEVT